MTLVMMMAAPFLGLQGPGSSRDVSRPGRSLCAERRDRGLSRCVVEWRERGDDEPRND